MNSTITVAIPGKTRKEIRREVETIKREVSEDARMLKQHPLSPRKAVSLREAFGSLLNRNKV